MAWLSADIRVPTDLFFVLTVGVIVGDSFGLMLGFGKAALTHGRVGWTGGEVTATGLFYIEFFNLRKNGCLN